MSKYFIDSQTLQDIADAIKTKYEYETGTTIKVNQFADLINALKAVKATYTVNHYKVPFEGDITLAESSSKTDVVGKSVSAQSKTYEGYTFNSNYENTLTSGTISDSSTLLLKLFYEEVTNKTRYTTKHYKVSTDGEATLAESEILIGVIGDRVLAKAKEYEGYKLVYNYENSKTNGVCLANNALTLNLYYTQIPEEEPSEEEVTTAKYTINHYRVVDNEATIMETQVLYGTIGSVVTIASKTYEGYTYDSSYTGTSTQGTITSDNSLVLSLYYKKDATTEEPGSGETTTTEGVVKSYRLDVVENPPTGQTSPLVPNWTINSTTAPWAIGTNTQTYEGLLFSTEDTGFDFMDAKYSADTTWKTSTGRGKYYLPLFPNGCKKVRITMDDDWGEHTSRRDPKIVFAQGDALNALVVQGDTSGTKGVSATGFGERQIVHTVTDSTYQYNNGDVIDLTPFWDDTKTYHIMSVRAYSSTSYASIKGCTIEFIGNITSSEGTSTPTVSTATYTINHYKVSSSGVSTLSHKLVLDATVGTTVTATQDTIEGYTYKSDYTGTKISGAVLEDGSLTLSLYYTEDVPVIYSMMGTLSKPSGAGAYQGGLVYEDDNELFVFFHGDGTKSYVGVYDLDTLALKRNFLVSNGRGCKHYSSVEWYDKANKIVMSTCCQSDLVNANPDYINEIYLQDISDESVMSEITTLTCPEFSSNLIAAMACLTYDKDNKILYVGGYTNSSRTNDIVLAVDMTPYEVNGETTVHKFDSFTLSSYHIQDGNFYNGKIYYLIDSNKGGSTGTYNGQSVSYPIFATMVIDPLRRSIVDILYVDGARQSSGSGYEAEVFGIYGGENPYCIMGYCVNGQTLYKYPINV